MFIKYGHPLRLSLLSLVPFLDFVTSFSIDITTLAHDKKSLSFKKMILTYKQQLQMMTLIDI